MGTPKPTPKDPPATGGPSEPAPDQWVDRPRAKPDIYISRPDLGRDPADKGER